MGERNNDDPRTELPPSVSENIGTIAEFSARHEESVSATQRFVEKTAHVLGSPGYVAVNIRSLYLLATVFLSKPLWRQWDVETVLNSWDANKKAGGARNDEDEERELDRLLD